MRLTSTGLGIGTSSPGNRLVVRSSGTSTAYAGNIGARFESNGAGYSSTIQLSNNVDASATLGLVGSNLAFGVGTTEMLRLDSSGNLGLGVTPSAWAGQAVTYYVAQFGGAAFYGIGTRFARMSANGYVDGAGTNRYIANGFATRHEQSDGNYFWLTAPSGTAGNAISFTQAMTLDASGNLGIGLTPVANNGILQLNSYASIQAMFEKATVSATAATGTINFDAATQAVVYYTSNASGNWTLNVRASSGTTLNTVMATGQSVTIAFLVTNGGTAFYQTGFQVDGSAVTPRWQGGTAPTAGNASSIDSYVITVIKTANATFTALASQTRFA
jgi:hypothetical protein